MKFYIIDEDQITLAHLLNHPSAEVRRHAKGALEALKRNAEAEARTNETLQKMFKEKPRIARNDRP